MKQANTIGSSDARPKIQITRKSERVSNFRAAGSNLTTFIIWASSISVYGISTFVKVILGFVESFKESTIRVMGLLAAPQVSSSQIIFSPW